MDLLAAGAPPQVDRDTVRGEFGRGELRLQAEFGAEAGGRCHDGAGQSRVVSVAQRMGRKNVRTDDPTERNDTKILEVVLVVSQPEGLVVGQRVTAFTQRGDD